VIKIGVFLNGKKLMNKYMEQEKKEECCKGGSCEHGCCHGECKSEAGDGAKSPACCAQKRHCGKRCLMMLLASAVVVYVLFSAAEMAINVKKMAKDLRFDPAKYVTVSAEGKASGKPDIANLDFSVLSDGKNPAQIQKENSEKMNKIYAYLKTAGIDEKDIRTTSYSLYPQYAYPEGQQPQIKGYSLNQGVSVKVRKTESVGEVMNNVVQLGANQVNNVQFSIDNTDSLKAQARAQAFEKAHIKAAEMAGLNGARIGGVVNFSEGSSFEPPIYMGYEKGGMGGGGASSPQFEIGSQEVSVGVTVTFYLK
jgi:hypothetical protein